MSSTPFPIENLPYGVISTPENPTPRCATALNTNAIDLSALEKDGYFKSVPGFETNNAGAIFSNPTLNTFAALPKSSQREVRALLTKHLTDPEIVSKYAVPLDNVRSHFPMDTRNFSDFYCSLEHTQN
ncbi:Fumarylacetoacetase, partial [Aspergillus crustosus]